MALGQESEGGWSLSYRLSHGDTKDVSSGLWRDCITVTRVPFA